MKTYWKRIGRDSKCHHDRWEALYKGMPATGYTGAQMAQAYQFPKVPATAPMPTVWIPELGGDYDSTVIGNWCSSRGFPMPNLRSMTTPGSQPPVSDPNGADVEVGLDIVVNLATIYGMFSKPANINVLFCDNSNAGMLAAYNYILANGKPGDVVSLSWGGPETSYGEAAIAQFEALFVKLCANGITLTFASGDNGPDDGTSSPVTDYPGCSAYGVDCGATTITLNADGSLASQVPWNSGGGASGGGYSKLIAEPSWQKTNIPPGPNMASSFRIDSKFALTGRGEPDCVANGDPATGWDTPFGIVGGTSAVAPFMAAYFAGVNALLLAAGKAPLGLPNALMYANEATCFTDVVSGSIGGGDNATPGWDPASGLGSVIGTAFASVALGQAPPTVNPPPVQPVLSLQTVMIAIGAELNKLEVMNTGYAIVNKAQFIKQVGAAIVAALNSQLGANVEPKAINWQPILQQLPTIINTLLPIVIGILQSQQPQPAPGMVP